MTAPASPAGGWFQAATCRSLGLSLQIRLRNTPRVLGSGARQIAAPRLLVGLRAYLRGELVYEQPEFGQIPATGTLIADQGQLALPADLEPDDELLLVADVRDENGESFASQEHQLLYTHGASGGQAYLLYDQQPARPSGAKPAPIVVLMPKIWLSDEIGTYVVVCNTWEVAAPTRQPEPVRFSLLDEHGEEACSWEYTFFYNEAKIFDLRQYAERVVTWTSRPRFFNLVGRGGASSFVLFAMMRNLRSNHFAIEHSLPPIYYMDGAIGPVRAQGCDVRLFERNRAR